MDVLRSAVSLLGHLDVDCQSVAADANLRKSKRLLAKIPTVIGHMQNVIDGMPIVGQEKGGDPTLDHAANLLYLMTGPSQRPSTRRCWMCHWFSMPNMTSTRARLRRAASRGR
jgi:citrate synthase